jgi:hypothetical protein
MIVDELLEIADATSIAASAGTAVVGDVIDLEATTSDIGITDELWIVIQVTTAIVAAGAGTLALQVVSDSLSTLGGGSLASCTLHLTTGNLVTAASTPAGQTAGSVLMAAKLPSGTYERYLGILATVATQTISAGAINAFLTRDYAKWLATADATN